MELLEQEWVRSLFVAFSRWAGFPREAFNILRRVDHYSHFFRQLDQTFSSLAQITQVRLFEEFGLETLRRAETPVRFLVHTLGLSWDREQLEDLAERGRVERMLVEASYQPWAGDLGRYLDFLKQDKGGQRKPKTLRCYLAAALCMCREADVTRVGEITQEKLDSHLRRNRGARTNLALFVRYLNQRGGAPLKLPSPTARSLVQRDRKLVREIDSLRQQLATAESDRQGRALVAALLSKSYQVPLRHVLSMQRSQVQLVGGSIILEIDGQAVPLVDQLTAPFMAHVLGGTSKFLFPGRNSLQPLSESAIRHHLNSPDLA